MFKKVFNCIIVFITLFYLDLVPVLAYEVNSDIADEVHAKISDIYMRHEQYKDIVGDYTEEMKVYVYPSSASYWWPIGSTETTEANGVVYANGQPETLTTTSLFGYRPDPFGSGSTVFHSGLDIAGGSGMGNVNVVAARDGIVVSTTTNCVSLGDQSCGGSYGNHVIIQHSDGNFTLYAHLHQDSITVSVGEDVKQGQVIAKMGSSGASTGAHLHFEVREGANLHSATVDPLNYISADKPRTVSSSSEFLEFLHTWEGIGKKDGDNYVVVDIGDGVRTVGSGVTLENNVSLFEKYGINIDNYPVGSGIPVEIVDQIEMEIVARNKSNIEKDLASNSITLKDNQIEALVSFVYNNGYGAMSDFIDCYKKYGDTQELYDNCFGLYVHVGGEVWQGLVRRRNAEWALFHDGIYELNS